MVAYIDARKIEVARCGHTMHRADLVVQFCDFEIIAALAGVSAQWRAASQEIANTCAVLADALAADRPEYLALINDAKWRRVCLAPARDADIRAVDLVARVAAQLSFAYSKSIGTISCAQSSRMLEAARRFACEFGGDDGIVAHAMTLGMICSERFPNPALNIRAVQRMHWSSIVLLSANLARNFDCCSFSGACELLDWILRDTLCIDDYFRNLCAKRQFISAFAHSVAVVPESIEWTAHIATWRYSDSSFVYKLIQNVCDVNRSGYRGAHPLTRKVYDVLAPYSALPGRLLSEDVLANEYIDWHFGEYLLRKSKLAHFFAILPFDCPRFDEVRVKFREIMLGGLKNRYTRVSYILYAALNSDARVFEYLRDMLWTRDDIEYIAKHGDEWWTYVCRGSSINIPWIAGLGPVVLQRLIARIEIAQIPLMITMQTRDLRKVDVYYLPRAEMFACMRAAIEHDLRVIALFSAHRWKAEICEELLCGDICATYGSEMCAIMRGIMDDAH